MRRLNPIMKILSIVSALLLLAPSVGFSAGGSSTDNSTVSYNKKSKSSYEDKFHVRFGEAKTLMALEKYDDAYNILNNLVENIKDEADRQNLLGFSARMAGNYEIAKRHYNKALSIDPEHRGALEYQGELFIKLGDMASAELNLAKLKEQCWIGCLELTKLKKAIDLAKN